MYKSNKILAGLVTSIALFSASVQAAPYVSGQVGAFGYGDNNVFKNIFNNEEDLGFTGRAALGYAWDINNCFQLGAEAGLNGYQDIDVDLGEGFGLKAKRWSADILGVADAHVTERFNVFAKAGAAYVKQKFPINYEGFQFLTFEDKGRFVPKAAVGVGYDVQENLNLNVSFNHEFEKDNRTAYVPAASSVMVGLKYSFS